MARSSLVFAAAGVLLVVVMAATAEASTKTITTTTTIEENRRPARSDQSDCYQQFVDQQMLRECGMYLLNNVKGSMGSWGVPRISRSQQERQKTRCCTELENMGEECMCPAINLLMNQQGMISIMGQMAGDMMRMAQNLPTQCKIRTQPCQMGSHWV